MILDLVRVKLLFLAVMLRAKARFSFRVENFCIMGNHIHLVMQPEEGESLSSIMQWILSVFAMAYNRQNNLSGHVWGERFYSRVIEDLATFLQVLLYIDENPVKANLVSAKTDWQYGGLWHHQWGIAGLVEVLPEEVLAIMPEHRKLAGT